MIDGNGRIIDYIRISVTDRCNLRCVYCMPEEGIEMVSHRDILSFDEICRLTRVFASMGISKIKLTGGEPLVRRGLPDLAKQLKQIPGIAQVTVTTNGILLGEQIEALAEAGIDGINISLDTKNPQVFEKITCRNMFEEAKKGLEKALEHPEIPLKLNCVPMGIPGQDPAGMAELAKDYPVHVRFIEMMPIGLGKKFEVCTEEMMLEELQNRYGTYHKFEGSLGNGPGHYYTFPGFVGKIGFISAVSHKFCSSCNRVRLTAQGYLKTCLQYDVGTDLRALLRKGASDKELRAAAEEAILRKPTGHQFDKEPSEHEEKHMMSQIGG